MAVCFPAGSGNRLRLVIAFGSCTKPAHSCGADPAVYIYVRCCKPDSSFGIFCHNLPQTLLLSKHTTLENHCTGSAQRGSAQGQGNEETAICLCKHCEVMLREQLTQLAGYQRHAWSSAGRPLQCWCCRLPPLQMYCSKPNPSHTSPRAACGENND